VLHVVLLYWLLGIALFCLLSRQFDYAVVGNFSATLQQGLSVKCLTYSQAKNSVYIALSNGRLVVCDATQTKEAIGSSPVKTECRGNDRPIHCIITRDLDDGFVF
jgi:hypothetical protein